MPQFSRAFATLSLVVTVMLALVACSDEDETDSTPDNSVQEGQTTMTFEITSTAFEDGQAIPARYTCTGEDISPPLALSNIPDGTASIALIMDDPDAPGRTWVHWVVFNLPGDTTTIPEAVTSAGDLPGSAIQGKNTWGRNDYGGPCPPRGEHRYFFKAYALDTMLALDTSATKADVLAAMEGHILAEAQLMGTYEK